MQMEPSLGLAAIVIAPENSSSAYSGLESLSLRAERTDEGRSLSRSDQLRFPALLSSHPFPTPPAMVRLPSWLPEGASIPAPIAGVNVGEVQVNTVWRDAE